MLSFLIRAIRAIRAIRVIRGVPKVVGPVRFPSLVVIFAAFLSARSAFGQRIPDLGYVFPPGGHAGTTVEVKLGGYDWTPDMEFFVLDRRAQLLADGPPGEILIPPPPYWFGSKGRLGAVPLPREIAARFVVPADCPPGPVYWQAANANGGTSTGVFIVGTGPEIAEEERRKAPQVLASLPVTLSGRVSKMEEVDRYRFVALRAGLVTCDLVARRLGANWHGCLEIRDATGKLLADVVDAEGLDVALTFAVQAGAEYEVAVRDIDHAGDRSYVYRLSIVAAPRVVAALPTAGRRGETREVEFVGIGVATGALQLESVARQVTFPTDPTRSSLVYSLETPFGTALPFDLFVSDLPEFVESAASETAPQALPAPAAVTGALDQPLAADRFLLQTKQGERWTIALEARRFGSPLDVALAVFGPDGKELANNDDLPGTTDAGLEFVAPADGGYQLVVSDMAARGGARAAVYRLSVARPSADFRLEVPQRVNVLLGGQASVLVKATRLGGFAGPIKLALAGLPTGVSVPADATIPADKSEWALTLAAAADATAAAALVKVTGEAKVGEATVTQTALASAAGNLVPRGPEGNLVSELLVTSMMKPRCKGRPVDQDTGRKVHRGTTFPADVIVERLEGYQGEIVLKMAARQSYQVQGITGDDIVVAPGVTEAIYPCHMPEWLETTRTSRMGMIAVVQMPDPQGRVRHLVAEMTGFITMTLEGPLLKLAHVPLETSVEPGQPFDVRLKISRAAKLAEPVRLELRVPEEFTGLFSAEPLVVPLDRQEAELRIVTTADPRLLGVRKFTIRATALQDGKWPAVSETTLEVDLSSAARADEALKPIEAGRIVEALKRATPIVETAAESYPFHRECFSCHHQTLPMLAMIATNRRGLQTSAKLLAEQAEFTHKSFRDSTESLQKGEGIGGRAMTVGYGLWALRLADHKSDETTAAMVTYLLKTQNAEGHWARQMSRPPLEDSNVTCTVLAAYGIQQHAAENQRAEVEAAVSKAKAWLAQVKLESQEDHVARLWGIDLLGGGEVERKAVRERVLAGQRDDGGWGQLADLSSDAYATGQTLYILQATGFSPAEPAYRRGVEFLLQAQCADGSWFVKTRSKPVQEYFDNGDPHEENQFISVPATCWAVAALAAER